jgi:hypothetical protein
MHSGITILPLLPKMYQKISAVHVFGASRLFPGGAPEQKRGITTKTSTTESNSLRGDFLQFDEPCPRDLPQLHV